MKNQKSQLPNIIESILFLAGNAVAIKDISEKLELSDDEVKKAIEELKNSKSEESGIKVITFKDKVQLTTNAEYAEDVAAVLNPIREKALTRAALETVAIIAYKQPITRQEIEEVRGAASDYAVQILLTHNLIEVVGRKDAIGKPLMFGTTDEFLKRFELQSLEELPNYEDLLEQVKQISGLAPRDTIYNEFEVVSLEEENDAEDYDREEVTIEDLENIGKKPKETVEEKFLIEETEKMEHEADGENLDAVDSPENKENREEVSKDEDKEKNDFAEDEQDSEMDAVDRFLNSGF